MAKAKADAAKKAPTIPATFLDNLLDSPVAAREAALSGIALMFAPQFFPNEKDSGKALSLTVAKIQEMIQERAEGREHEELLKAVEIDADSILGSLTDDVTDILTGDSTKRFVLTLRWDSAADNGEGKAKGAYVLTPSIQTARGRKAKATEEGGED